MLAATLSAFAAELRRAGLPVSSTETIDAVRAVGEVGIDDRTVLRAALAVSFVKDASHLLAFDTVFDAFFFRRTPPGTDTGQAGAAADALVEAGELEAAAGAVDARFEESEAIAALVRAALVSADARRQAALAAIAVARHAGIDPSRPVGVSYYLYRTLRALDLDGSLAGLLEQVRAGEEIAGISVPPMRDERLRRRLIVEELERSAEAIRRSVESELTRRLAEERGTAAVASGLRRTLVEDVEFMHASRDDLRAMRRALQPLARVLAARLSRRRRRGRHGPLDFRATIRRSLSTGGVPIVPRFRPPRRAKPELVVLADVSGSVASFARFTLHLVHAIGSQFSAVRTFVFVDGVDEVTRIFETSSSTAEAVERVEREAVVCEGDGHSDYGAALARFSERYLSAVSSRSTVLVLGDGRGNYHPGRPELLGEIARRAKHLYWLNPEPRAYWGSGDSIVEVYEPSCDEVVECRNLRQLEAFVDSLA